MVGLYKFSLFVTSDISCVKISGTKWSQQQSTASPSCIQELFNVAKGEKSWWTCEGQMAAPHKWGQYWTWYKISSWLAQLVQEQWCSFLWGLQWSWSKGLHSKGTWLDYDLHCDDIYSADFIFDALFSYSRIQLSRRICVQVKVALSGYTNTASKNCYLKGYTQHLKIFLNLNGIWVWLQ